METSQTGIEGIEGIDEFDDVEVVETRDMNQNGGMSAMVRQPKTTIVSAMKNTHRVASGLGWFSIGLGVLELVAAKPIAKALGLSSPTLVRLFGLREIGAGLGLLTQRKKGPWIWARVAGDALDAAVLLGAMRPGNRKRGNAALVFAAVSPVIIADIVCGTRLGISA